MLGARFWVLGVFGSLMAGSPVGFALPIRANTQDPRPSTLSQCPRDERDQYFVVPGDGYAAATEFLYAVDHLRTAAVLLHEIQVHTCEIGEFGSVAEDGHGLGPQGGRR